MRREPLRALLVDVGGTLVDDATWIERSAYEALMVARLHEAFGVRPSVGRPIRTRVELVEALPNVLLRSRRASCRGFVELFCGPLSAQVPGTLRPHQHKPTTDLGTRLNRGPRMLALLG